MVFHASTNPLVLAENVTFTAAELVLEQRFVDYWTSFVMTGNPNSGVSAMSDELQHERMWLLKG
jgi:hypothetical protein